MANSSGEVIMYKESLPENILVSKTIIDLFSILQQQNNKCNGRTVKKRNPNS